MVILSGFRYVSPSFVRLQLITYLPSLEIYIAFSWGYRTNRQEKKTRRRRRKENERTKKQFEKIDL